MEVHQENEHFQVTHQGRVIISHHQETPWITVGRGHGNFAMRKGSFKVEDTLVQKIPLTSLEMDTNHALNANVTTSDDTLHLVARGLGGVTLKVTITTTQFGDLQVTFDSPAGKDNGSGENQKSFNRLWMQIPATKDEALFGGGEQFSHFNLRGKKFPLWVSEQGVGRNKSTYETFLSDSNEGAGGDYYTTYFPQPTFISSEKYFLHVEDSHYMVFDFREPTHHELEIWGIPRAIRIGMADTYTGVLEMLSAILGRQPELPDWAYDGVWLGMQGGTEIVEAKLQRALSKGLRVAAIWAQDWEGKRVTPFGKQLMWNWKWDRQLYPNLDDALVRWQQQGVRFLGYINCFLAIEGDLYTEAKENGYLVRNHSGEAYHVVCTSFPAGMVDLTNPAAVAWLKGVIQHEMIDFGLSGWMADFAEYLPTDAVLFAGDAEELHNQWPVLWAKLNREAVEEHGRLGDVVFFMRAGYAESGRYTTMMWAGDQNVDWSPDDGLPSVIPAALSLGMSGLGLHHSDIGGYTTLFHMKRTKELFMRWVEQATFTVLMRTHEGNRPDDNWQFDGDDETLEHFAWMSQVHVALKPYLQTLVQENHQFGIPVVRPVFLHYESETEFYEIQDTYLLGRDLLVAPILAPEMTSRSIRLPEDDWIHLWSGRAYSGGVVDVAAPLGEPPVFYRASSNHRSLFEQIKLTRNDFLRIQTS